MNPIKILLIEDNEGDIVLTVEALRDFQIPNEVTVIKDGWEALQYLENKGDYTDQPEPDLVLLDVNLPKLDGHELLMKVKNNKTKMHIPIVMLTTSSAQADVLRSYQNHANCFITKPLDVEDYGRVLSSIENFWFSVVQLPKKT
ncbi:MAG TPA: response regulator [Flavobacterium sp.]|jgi:CheY-like chemotaxis protein|nr:response regulator [Flavobacterium sp.]